jgi:hypothetical protein
MSDDRAEGRTYDSFCVSPPQREAGQAAVEAALTLPLVVFLMLGTLQLFLMLQGRILAQYAVGRAARAGSLNHGRCNAMNEAAVAALLPSFHSFLTPGGSAGAKYLAAFKARQDNHFDAALDRGHDREIVWIDRSYANLPADTEEDFDLLYSATDNRTQEPLLLELHLVYWYPLRIPFANWVMSRMALAHYGLLDYEKVNPLMPVKGEVVWTKDGVWQPEDQIRAELYGRVKEKQYTFPIDTTFVTRMMTPPRNFAKVCWSGK